MYAFGQKTSSKYLSSEGSVAWKAKLVNNTFGLHQWTGNPHKNIVHLLLYLIKAM